MAHASSEQLCVISPRNTRARHTLGFACSISAERIRSLVASVGVDLLDEDALAALQAIAAYETMALVDSATTLAHYTKRAEVTADAVKLASSMRTRPQPLERETAMDAARMYNARRVVWPTGAGMCLPAVEFASSDSIEYYRHYEGMNPLSHVTEEEPATAAATAASDGDRANGTPRDDHLAAATSGGQHDIARPANGSMLQVKLRPATVSGHAASAAATTDAAP